MTAEGLVRQLEVRKVARAVALLAVAVDLAAACLDAGDGEQYRRPARIGRHAVDTMRLPIVVPRAYVGAAVLGGIGTLAAMGEGFGLYIFLAGIALIALALSQAAPRRPLAVEPARR